MKIVSVIIPYYQREAGILRQAVSSIIAQELPNDWCVEIHVVDDGSPHPASEELAGLTLSSRMHSRVYLQPNGGAAAARNTGLDKVQKNSVLTAYLDSDDTWPSGHVAAGIQAYESGYDFYFCDNHRLNHHVSHIGGCERTKEQIESGKTTAHGFIEISSKMLPALVIKEFPTHASSVIHVSSMATGIRFSTRLRCSGEDVLYFFTLSSKTKRPCFNPNKIIICGSGVNIFFSNLKWDNPRYMGIKRDQVIAYTLISRLPFHSELTAKVIRHELKMQRSDFVFHLVRRLYRKRERIPKEVYELIRFDPRNILWFPVILYRVLRYYDV